MNRLISAFAAIAIAGPGLSSQALAQQAPSAVKYNNGPGGNLLAPVLLQLQNNPPQVPALAGPTKRGSVPTLSTYWQRTQGAYNDSVDTYGAVFSMPIPLW